MFSLIITIVSIALVVALVAATMYHGGDTLTQGRTQADAAAFVAGAQQVGGAAVMYQAMESAAPVDAAALVTGNYLSSLPAVKSVAPLVLDTAEREVQAVVVSPEVCEAINKSAGIATPAAVTALGNAAYGCITLTKAFSFKY